MQLHLWMMKSNYHNDCAPNNGRRAMPTYIFKATKHANVYKIFKPWTDMENFKQIRDVNEALA